MLASKVNASSAVIWLYPHLRSLIGSDWLTVKSPARVGRGFPAGKVPGTSFDKRMLSLYSFVSRRMLFGVLLRERWDFVQDNLA